MMDTMKLLRAIAFTLFIASGSSHATSSDWQIIGQRDIFRIVYISPAASRVKAVYLDAVRNICGKRMYCNVAFFAEDKPITSVGKGRLTDDDLIRVLMTYTTKDGLKWNCQFMPEADNCFQR